MTTNVTATRQSRDLPGRAGRIEAITMVVLGALILVTWAGFIATGTLDQGLRTVENNQYLIFHLIAEILMAALLIYAGAGLLRRTSWALPVAFLGLGMTIYSTINSLSHSIHNEPALTPVLIVTLVVALAITTTLVRVAGESIRPKVSNRETERIHHG